jgi:hypothetical protein
MKVFVNTWDVKTNVELLLNALHEIKKKENEIVVEFNIRFQHVLDNLCSMGMCTQG